MPGDCLTWGGDGTIPAMGEVAAWRVRAVRWPATGLGVIAAASMILLIRSVITGDNEPSVLLGIPPLLALGLVPQWPLRGPSGLRRRAGIVGWLLLGFGALLLLVYVGVILILFAVPFLAAAYVPPRDRVS
jgi:hypothetical protein